MSFVAFSFPTTVTSASEVLAALSSLSARDLTVESVHQHPNFAIITSSKPAALSKACGRLQNDVLLFPISLLLDHTATPAAILPQDDLDHNEEQQQQTTSLVSPTAVLQIRAFVIKVLAFGYVGGEKFLHKILCSSTQLVRRYHVATLLHACTDTASQVATDLDNTLGLTEKVGYVKNKLSKVTEKAMPVQKAASSVVTHVTDAGHKLAEKARHLPLISWGFNKLSSISNSGLSLLHSMTESTVNDFEKRVSRLRLEDETCEVQCAVRSLNNNQGSSSSSNNNSTASSPRLPAKTVSTA